MSDSSSSSGDDTRAALSGSRSTSRRRTSSSARYTGLDRPAYTIVIEESSSKSRSSSPAPSTTSKKSKVSKIDLLGETSIYLSSSLSISIDDREDVNYLLDPSQYAALPTSRVPRDEWIPGYSCRVSRSTAQVSPRSSRRVSYTSIAELEVDFMIKHFAKLKSSRFPHTRIRSLRNSRLITGPPN